MEKELLIKKIQDATLQMMKDVTFNEKRHIYTRTSNGEWLQGVSTVSSIIPKGWLDAWGAKEAVKALGFTDYPDRKEDLERAEEIRQKIIACKTFEGYQAILREAKGASRRKSKDALVDGRAGHEWLEKWVLAKIRKTELPKIPEGLLERPLTQFIEWSDREVDYWILSEARVANLSEKYAGTMDALAMMKSGKLAVIDFKFGSHISEDYYLQTAGYQNCFEKHGIKIDERIIVRLPKTLIMDEWNSKIMKYEKVENKIEVKVCDNLYEMDRDVFLHMLPVKKWINIMENKNRKYN